jgi:transcriptional regulator with XRE-family HTH domain
VLAMKKVINLDYLKKYMEQNKISESKLAELIGVDYTTVYRVFKGNRNPGAKFITGLIKSGLDIDLKEIFSNN